MKALITGGTGFVGRALTVRLIADGHTVRVLTRNTPGKAQPGVEFVKADYARPETLALAVDGCEAVFHLAAALFAADEREFIKANVDATANLVKACNTAPHAPKTLVYLSSLAAGGPSENPDEPRDENRAEAPVSAYGRTKLGGEKELSALKPEIRRVILRAPIVYGPNDSGVSVIAKWVKAGLMLNPGGGKARFSFIFIDDLVTSLHRAGTDYKLSGLYYVSECAIYEWRQFLLDMAQAMNCKPPLMLSIPALPLKLAAIASEAGAALLGKAPVFNRDKARESLAGHWVCTARRWEGQTGFTAWTSLSDGLAKTFRK